MIPSVASAHAYLVKSVPAGRATLFSSPGKIQLWFNERLEAKYSSASVYGPESALRGKPRCWPKIPSLSVALQHLAPGRYTVKFRVLSIDGHVVEQGYPFTIREGK
jgi:methionine-rich copper-binding protein CopC